MSVPVFAAISTSRLMLRTWGGILWLLVIVSLFVTWFTPLPPRIVREPGVELVFETPEGNVPMQLVQRKVAPFTFTERNGDTVTRETLAGKPWVVNFIFTSCVMSCPANTTAMMKLAQACRDLDVRFVTITVDPERDTPERLRDYAEIYGADPEQWLFLTGEKEEIHKLIRQNFLLGVEERQGSDRLLGYEFAHSDQVMYLDAEGTIVGKFLSTDPVEMTKLRRVLAGEMEIPEEHKFLVPEPIKEPAGAEPAAGKPVSIPPAPAIAETAETVEGKPAVPGWLAGLPAVNASLNGLATVLLLMGFVFIRQKQISRHRNCMVGAFAVSIVFLACYLVYHFGLQYYTGESSKRFPGEGFIKALYLTILISHILLAMSVPILSVGTLIQAWNKNWDRHRIWASITFPIWLYVSVTGVLIYLMLYHLIS